MTSFTIPSLPAGNLIVLLQSFQILHSSSISLAGEGGGITLSRNGSVLMGEIEPGVRSSRDGTLEFDEHAGKNIWAFGELPDAPIARDVVVK